LLLFLSSKSGVVTFWKRYLSHSNFEAGLTFISMRPFNCRLIATRYEKLASTYAAMLYLACAKRLLRQL
jgi:hypothetical protein